MNRRTYLGAAGCAGLAGLAGCIGLLGLDEHVANPIGVDENVRAETEYRQTGIDDLVIEETVDMRLWSETISVTNYIVEHEKRVGIEPLIDERAAVFVTLSTPQISVVGQQVNPVEDMETAELVELVADNYEDIGSPSHADDAEITILDQDVITSTFVADATFVGGHDVEVNLHVTEAIETDEDLVVAIGVYPRELESEERANVEALMSAIDPEIDVRGEGGDDGGSDDGGDGDGNGDGGGDDDGGNGDGGGDDGDGGGDDDDGDDDDDGIGVDLNL